MNRLKDLTGLRFNYWLVISRSESVKGQTYWTCRCDCGTTRNVLAGNLTKVNGTKSCGCYRVLNCSEIGKKYGGKTNPTIHGHFVGGKMSPTYSVWSGMIKRCENPNTQYFKNYGGRGISVCSRWRESFVNFLEDMGERPNGLQIDRINNDDNYYKENCRWTTAKINMGNRRNSKLINLK